MLNEERRRKILEIINEEGGGLVKEIASRLQTSRVTIRKDLELVGPVTEKTLNQIECRYLVSRRGWV